MQGGITTYDAAEANRALPEVRRLAGRIVELSALLPELQDQLRIEEYRMSRPGAGRDEADRFERAVTGFRQAEKDLSAAVNGLGGLGVVLKDAQQGLVDFYGYRDGELVELCWKLGEASVSHWHRIGEGYGGRRPL